MGTSNTTEQVEVAQIVPVSFWQTSRGILVKRIGFLVASVIVAQLIAAITNDGSLFGPSTPIVYLVLTTVRDILDPKIPNSTSQAVVK